MQKHISKANVVEIKKHIHKTEKHLAKIYNTNNLQCFCLIKKRNCSQIKKMKRKYEKKKKPKQFND